MGDQMRCTALSYLGSRKSGIRGACSQPASSLWPQPPTRRRSKHRNEGENKSLAS
jgi:hypothetical protein